MNEVMQETINNKGELGFHVWFKFDSGVFTVLVKELKEERDSENKWTCEQFYYPFKENFNLGQHIENQIKAIINYEKPNRTV